MNYKYLYLSKPDFVFFFDPKLEIQTKVATNIKDAMFIKVGFMKEGEETLLGAGMRIFAHGELHQGYLKGNKGEYFARVFLPNGDCYAGKCKQSKSHGKGEYEYADGRKLIGKWVDDVREGRFKYIDKNGKDSFKFFKKGIEE